MELYKANNLIWADIGDGVIYGFAGPEADRFLALAATAPDRAAEVAPTWCNTMKPPEYLDDFDVETIESVELSEVEASVEQPAPAEGELEAMSIEDLIVKARALGINASTHWKPATIIKKIKATQ